MSRIAADSQGLGHSRTAFDSLEGEFYRFFYRVSMVGAWKGERDEGLCGEEG